jgi:hypothetical protein
MQRSLTTELSRGVVWHGHARDLARLVESVDAHCTCGRAAQTCGTHLLFADQHTLDHLAFARSVRHRLIEEEWRLPARPETRADRAEWSAFLVRCASAGDPAPVPARRRERIALGPWVISLIALLIALGMRSPSPDGRPPVQPLASWQTR